MDFIKDPVLEPYFIQIDDLNYSAFHKIIPDSGIPYDSLVGHFSTLGRALERICGHKVRQQFYDYLRGYIEELNTIKNELKNLI